MEEDPTQSNIVENTEANEPVVAAEDPAQSEYKWDEEVRLS